jgi:hypothetical protein
MVNDGELIFWVVALILALGFLVPVFCSDNSKVSDETLRRIRGERTH